MAGCYVTVFSLINQISSKQAESDTKKVVKINDEYGVKYVESISNDVLWNCRYGSSSRSTYVSVFAALLVILGFVYIFTACWSLCCQKKFSNWFQFLSSVVLKVSFIFLLTTYDVSLWDCFCGPSDIEYSKETKKVDLKFNNSTKRYQLIGSNISLVLFFVSISLSLIHKYRDRDKCRPYTKCFEFSIKPEDEENTKKNIIKFVDSAKDIKKNELEIN